MNKYLEEEIRQELIVKIEKELKNIPEEKLMKKYEKIIKEHNLTSDDIEQICTVFIDAKHEHKNRKNVVKNFDKLNEEAKYKPIFKYQTEI